jgi:hypothetical protein
MKGKTKRVGFYGLTIVAMIALIPLVTNDYYLLLAYILFPLGLYWFCGAEKHDGTAYLFGLIGITISEYFFISTGVETFNRTTLLGVMPLWLPFLWAYAFVVIKRTLHILDR